MKLYFGITIMHEDRVPAEGPFILCANHASYLDPVLLGAFCPRPIKFMMSKIYYDIPPIGFITSFYGAFPVNVEGIDRSTFRKSQEVLQSNDVLGIFPEGGRTRDGGFKPARPGAMLLALRERVPVLPVAITGAFEAYPPSLIIPRPRPMTVNFGECFTAHLDYEYPKDKKMLPELSDMLMEKIACLAEEALRG